MLTMLCHTAHLTQPACDTELSIQTAAPFKRHTKLWIRCPAPQVPRGEAQYILSTAHGMKGREEGWVQLAEDFIYDVSEARPPAGVRCPAGEELLRLGAVQQGYLLAKPNCLHCVHAACTCSAILN